LGFGVGGWGIGPNPQSPIPNPQSPLYHLNKLINNLKLLFIIKNNYNN
jgi:hypothetical protein